MTAHPQPEHDCAELEALARRARYLVLKTVQKSGGGHVGGPLSAMDLLVALYFRVLRIRPEDPVWGDRDRFILSKGHAAVGLYTVLALRGYLPVDELATFDMGDSRLQGHPDMTRLPGVDASTGSLGQGLSYGAGIALGATLAGRSFHTFVLLGDGEIQEGMVWEAAHTAVRYRLGNLTAILDWNGLQQIGWPGRGRGDRRDPWDVIDPRAVFRGFGWRVRDIDGHAFPEILDSCRDAVARAPDGVPTVIVARTTKGKGVSFMENRSAWHSRVPTADELAEARRELRQNAEEGVP